MAGTRSMGGTGNGGSPPAGFPNEDLAPYTPAELYELCEPGKIVGGCQVVKFIAAGGESIVLEGRQRVGENKYRRVAIRVCLGRDHVTRARFLQGSLVMGELHSPHFLRLIGGGVAAEQPFSVMEYLEGETLAKVLKSQSLRGRPLELVAIRKILHDLCAGAAALHQHGIVHRDLKPDNLMLIGQVPGHEPYLGVILDPGTVLFWMHHTADARTLLLQAAGGQVQLPALHLGEERFGPVTRTRLTVAGQVMGTPDYMAPEACLTSTIDRRADVYAIGVMLVEMLTSKLPHSAGTSLVEVQRFLLDRVQRQHYRTLEVAHPEFLGGRAPDGFLAALYGALQWDPDKRFNDAMEFYQAVAPHLGPRRAPVRSVQQPTPRALPVPQLKRQWLPYTVGAGAGIIVILLLLAVLRVTGLVQFGEPTYLVNLKKVEQVESEPAPPPRPRAARPPRAVPAPGVPRAPARPVHRRDGGR